VSDKVAQGGAPTDEELLAQSAAGDRGAFEAVVSRHQAAVFRLARALTGSRADAEDVLQEAFLSAFLFARGFRGEATVRTWLLTITRHAAYRLARKRGAPSEDIDSVPLPDLGWRAGWSQNDPETLAMKAQRRERLDRALQSLSPEAREVLVLRDLEGLSGEETAAMLGIELAAMKSRLHRARLALAAALRHGGSHDRT
jgi:RNA polymerase sigma-70 factor (ECF subfamily)